MYEKSCRAISMLIAEATIYRNVEWSNAIIVDIKHPMNVPFREVPTCANEERDENEIKTATKYSHRQKRMNTITQYDFNDESPLIFK